MSATAAVFGKLPRSTPSGNHVRGIRVGALLYDGYVDACLTTFIALWFAIIVATQGAMEGDDHGGHG